ncbi:tetratricopeptide repeat-containing sensor histidine kinase [Fulvivirgaceae bacterium BMA10]|uniref:histidine kinase n=1 Tax=Splendidivirga corallicola TaxID=3051826 RepID=A0ABT8KZ69_9BACT|nr:tetratricopeptide repeat-containing sensor histidine kinase [Fulvivirgaceae bacterium BMA10]
MEQLICVIRNLELTNKINYQWLKKAFLTVGLFLLPYLSLSQNQKIADSLVSILINGSIEDSTRLKLLEEITFNQTSTDSILFYSNLLIREAKLINDHIYVHKGYYYQGEAYKLKGDLEKALKAYFDALRILKQSNFKSDVGTTYAAIADTYSINKNHKNSIYYYNEALNILRSQNDSIFIATVLLNAGDEYYNYEKLDSAFLYFEEAHLIFLKFNYEIGLAYSLGNIGLLFAKQQKYDSAQINIENAISILNGFGDNYAISDYQIQMSSIFLENNDYTSALQYATSGYLTAKKEGLKEQIRDASLKLSELYQSQGDFQKALEFQAQYYVYRDSISNAETIQRMADLRTEFEVSRKQAEVDLLSKTKQIQQIVAIGLVIGLLLVAGLAFTLYRGNQRKKLINNILSAQKEEIEVQNDLLENLNKTKDRFFSIISHDLRGPVNSFRGVSKIIRSYVEKDQMDQLLHVTGLVDQSANQLSSLLDNLLNWALSQQGNFPYRPEKLSAASMANEIQEIFGNIALAKNITFNKIIEEDPEVWADRNSALTILRNLVSNAIKFTPEEGEVTLTLDMQDGFAEFRISDTGVGIPKEKIKTIFELNEKNSTYGTAGEKGTGLGLILVKEFVQMNGGDIHIESEEGQGTTFIVTLPLSKEQLVISHE